MNTEHVIAGIFAAIIIAGIFGYLKIWRDERDGKA